MKPRRHHTARRQEGCPVADPGQEVMHLQDSLMPKYAELVYYGFWFAPETYRPAEDDRRDTEGRHRHRAAETL